MNNDASVVMVDGGNVLFRTCCLPLVPCETLGANNDWRHCLGVFQGNGNKNRLFVRFLAHLLLTPMSSVVIPPPMSAHTLQTECSINQVTFHPTCQHLALLLSDGKLVIVTKTLQKNESTENRNSSEFFQARHVSLVSIQYFAR
jgi:hypothetical protein